MYECINMRQMISVLIATRNRNEDLAKCLSSILKNKKVNFEILVMDQSSNQLSKLLCDDINDKKIRYYHLQNVSKSFALNTGIKKAKGNILAFTDDDCIVSHHWLNTIDKIFLENKDASVIFGKSLPYKKETNNNLICPSIFTSDSKRIFTKPVYHASNIGFGNNMAIKRQKITHELFFSDWLGPGTSAYAAEDADIALRFLINKKKIVYDPKMLVFHNKWLTPKENYQQFLKYLCGETACYGYYYFLGHSFAKSIVKNNFKDSLYQFKYLIKKHCLLYKNSNEPIFVGTFCLELFYRTKGLIIGLINSLKFKIKLFFKNCFNYF